jgi:Mn-containing catalase
VKALPKLAKAARSDFLRQAFEQHLAETEDQVARLKEIFRLLGHKATPKPCKGMSGLLAEGQNIITKSKEKEDLAADLALIAAAQKVEHYEMSGYLGTRALAGQAGATEVQGLLSQSLLEEERADKVLSRLATLLMEGAAAENAASPVARRARRPKVKSPPQRNGKNRRPARSRSR